MHGQTGQVSISDLAASLTLNYRHNLKGILHTIIVEEYPHNFSSLPKEIHNRLVSKNDSEVVSGLTILVEFTRAYKTSQFDKSEQTHFQEVMSKLFPSILEALNLAFSGACQKQIQILYLGCKAFRFAH